jgi:hypothetical protein
MNAISGTRRTVACFKVSWKQRLNVQKEQDHDEQHYASSARNRAILLGGWICLYLLSLGKIYKDKQDDQCPNWCHSFLNPAFQPHLYCIFNI